MQAERSSINEGSLAQVDNTGRLVFRPSDFETEDVLQARGMLAQAAVVVPRRAQSASAQNNRTAKDGGESTRPASAASSFYIRPDPFALLHDKYSTVLSGKAAQPEYPLSKYEKWLGIGRIKLHSLETLDRLQEDLKGQDVPEELKEYLHNTRYLLGKVDKACKMLMRLAGDKDSSQNGHGQGNVFAGQTQAACRDLTKDLGEALPQLISQVAMYQETLCSTEGKLKQSQKECQELQKKSVDLQELCNKERRQKEFFREKRKVELGAEQQRRTLGIETNDGDEDVFDKLDSSGKDLDMLVYSERDLAEKKKEWTRKKNAQFAEERHQIEADWSKKSELERKRAAEELEKQRQEYLHTINELRSKLGAAGGEFGQLPTRPSGRDGVDVGFLGEYDTTGGERGSHLGMHHSSTMPNSMEPYSPNSRTEGTLRTGGQSLVEGSATRPSSVDPDASSQRPSTSDGGGKGSRKTKDKKSNKVAFSPNSSSQQFVGQSGETSPKHSPTTNKEGVAPSSDKDPVWSEVRAVEAQIAHSSQGGVAQASRPGGFSGTGATLDSGDPADSFASALFSMRLITLQNAFQKLMGRLQDTENASMSALGSEDLKETVEAVLHEAGKELQLKAIRMFEQARVVLKRAEGSSTCISKESSAEEMQQLRSALVMPEAGTAAMKVDLTSCGELQRRLEGRQQAMVEANDRWLRQVLSELGLKADFVSMITEDAIANASEGGIGDQNLAGNSVRATTPGGTQRKLQFRSGTGDGSSSRILSEAEYGEDLNDSGYRQVVKGVRRRIFEEIMSEERERMTKRAEEELMTKCEVGGMAELAHLVRRVEDMNLRRELCRALKDYGRRLPSAIEVVCKFCRRKVKKEQVHSYNAPNSIAFTSEIGGRPQSSPGLSRTFTSPETTLSNTLDESQQTVQSDASVTSSLRRSKTLPMQATLLPAGHPKSLSHSMTLGPPGPNSTLLRTASGVA